MSKKDKKAKAQPVGEICGKPWRGMAGEGVPPAICKQRPGHNGSCGPKSGWIWVDDRDAVLGVLGPQHPPWERK